MYHYDYKVVDSMRESSLYPSLVSRLKLKVWSKIQILLNVCMISCDCSAWAVITVECMCMGLSILIVQ